MKTLKKMLRRLGDLTKSYWKPLLVLIATSLGIAGRSFLGEVTQQLWSKWSSDPPALAYRILSVDRLFSGSEISQYALREFGGDFNLQLDDTILRDYDIFKIRIQNDGGPIDSGFTVEVLINNGLAKIMDVKHAVRVPTNKSIPIDYSLPNLSWDTKAIDEAYLFAWNDPVGPSTVAGTFLYRSIFKETGYGKFNFGVIKQNCIVFSPNALVHGYYAAASVGVTGELSKLSPPVRFPDWLIFQPKFKDIVWIDSQNQSDTQCAVDRRRTYASLKDAIAKEGTNRTFIFRNRKASSDNMRADSDQSVRVLKEDDLKFLRGRIEFKFPDGVDGRSQIDFYFLTKAPLDAKRSVRLSLRGVPKLTFTSSSESYKDSGNKPTASVNSEKLSLTPIMISSYATKQAVVIRITGKSSNVNGIRIFRSIVQRGNSSGGLGDEIYDDRGIIGSLSCSNTNSDKKDADVRTPLYEPTAPEEPPPRPLPKPPANIPAPAAPKGLTLNGGDVAGSSSASSTLFFEDTGVKPNLNYKYTIYLYNKTVYSYPVEVFASLGDVLPGLDCTLIKQSANPGTQKK